MISLADFFGILTHILIQSQLRDRSCHLDCGRASFYNDALLFVEARRPFKEREVDSEPLAQWDIRETCFINQGGRLIARISLALIIQFNTKDDSNIPLAFKMIAEEMAKAWACWSIPAELRRLC